MKLDDDERPESPYLVHEWEGRKFWNLMARSIRVVSPTVLEVKFLFERRVRVICFMLMLIWGALPVISSMSSGDPPLALYKRSVDSFMLAFFPETALKETYERSMSWRVEADQVSFESYVADYVDWRPFGDRFRAFLFDMTLPGSLLILVYYALFYPVRAPIRIDRELRLIYTRRGRHLYVKTLPFDYDPHADWRDEDRSAESLKGWWLEYTVPLLSNVGSGQFKDVLAVRMHRIDRPEKTKDFRLGTYPLTHGTQGEDIENVIFAFSYLPRPGRTGKVARPYDPAWQARLYRDRRLALDWLRWLAGRTLGRHHHLDEDKIKDQLLDYATR